MGKLPEDQAVRDLNLWESRMKFLNVVRLPLYALLLALALRGHRSALFGLVLIAVVVAEVCYVILRLRSPRITRY